MNGSSALIQSYVNSDGAGKAIFLALLFLSCLSWMILLSKWWALYRMKQAAHALTSLALKNHGHLLKLEVPQELAHVNNPAYTLFTTLKQRTAILLNKNESALFRADIDLLGSYLDITVTQTLKKLEEKLFILSTIATLGPFLGLLGTVWGILTTFSQLSAKSGGSNETILAGLAMALGTTILGLLVAIPALVGFNILKNGNRQMVGQMHEFSTFLLATVQMQYCSHKT